MSQLKTTSLSHKDNNTGTPNITLYPDGTTSLPGMAMGGFRNQLINGQGLIAQRSLNNVAAADGDYPSLDRWHTASGIQLLKVYNPESVCPGFPTGARVITTTNRWVRQLIELPSTPGGAVTYAPGIFHGINQFTLSIWSDRAVEVAYSFADNNKLDNFTPVASNHAMTATGITRTSINGVVYQLYTDTFNINNVIPAATNAAFSVQFSFEANQTTNWTGAQLEPGPVATPYEHRPIGVELSLCQRYYEAIDCQRFYENCRHANTGWTNTGFTTVQFAVPKRVNPTRSLTDFNNRDNCASLDFIQSSENMVVLQGITVSSGYPYYVWSGTVRLDAEL